MIIPTSIQTLKHVANAINHAFFLADEAEDIGMNDWVSELRATGTHLEALLDAAWSLHEAVEPARINRCHAHAHLEHAYEKVSLALSSVLDANSIWSLSPLGLLDVVSRVRFRLRRWPYIILAANIDEAAKQKLDELKAFLEKYLEIYERAVDAYLWTGIEAQRAKERIVEHSQTVRGLLQCAKHDLLLQLPPNSDAHKRVQKQIVRTRPGRHYRRALQENRFRPLSTSLLVDDEQNTPPALPEQTTQKHEGDG